MALCSRDVDQEMGLPFVSLVEPVLLDKLWNSNQQDYWLCYKVARQASYMVVMTHRQHIFINQLSCIGISQPGMQNIQQIIRKGWLYGIT